MTIRVSHFPPGTSKWNKIEHRLFSHISLNWRGQPLVSHEVIVALIAATTTQAGLKVHAAIDDTLYPKGRSRSPTLNSTRSKSLQIPSTGNGIT